MFFLLKIVFVGFFDNSILFLIQPYKSKRHQVICKNRLSFALIFLFEHFFILIVLVFLGVIVWKLRVFFWQKKTNCPSIPPDVFYNEKPNGSHPVTSPSHPRQPFQLEAPRAMGEAQKEDVELSQSKASDLLKFTPARFNLAPLGCPCYSQDAGSSPPGLWTIFRIGDPNKQTFIRHRNPGKGNNPT